MDEELLIPVRLSAEGFGGTPEQIASMRTDYVMAALEFSRFKSDYAETYQQINQSKK